MPSCTMPAWKRALHGQSSPPQARWQCNKISQHVMVPPAHQCEGFVEGAPAALLTRWSPAGPPHPAQLRAAQACRHSSASRWPTARASPGLPARARRRACLCIDFGPLLGWVLIRGGSWAAPVLAWGPKVQQVVRDGLWRWRFEPLLQLALDERLRVAAQLASEAARMLGRKRAKATAAEGCRLRACLMPALLNCKAMRRLTQPWLFCNADRRGRDAPSASTSRCALPHQSLLRSTPAQPYHKGAQMCAQ